MVECPAMNEQQAQRRFPLGYFVTFTCYGTWLHGDERGSVDPTGRAYGAHLIPPDPLRSLRDFKQMDQPPYELDQPRRKVVLRAVQSVCEHRGWVLLAAHVRTRHVHSVVAAKAAPEQVLNTFKAYSSRALNLGDFDAKDCKRWTRHGSTRYLWGSADLLGAIKYVVEDQGEPMEVFRVDDPLKAIGWFKP